GRKLLKHPYRVGRAQDGYRAREADSPRSRRCRRENQSWGGVEIFTTMVFADSEYVQPHLIGVLDLLDQVQQTLRRADGQAALVVCRCEAVDSDLHEGRISPNRARAFE